ncbi:MAG: HNH endonuclease, partial [Algicola sp.]|nr:HNH endonuclease [Algicola sp.]
LPQVEGGLLIKAIEEIMRQEDRNASAEAHEEGRNDSAEASEKGLVDVPVVEKATYSQRRADAMSVLVEHFIATATVDDENGGAQALAGHERVQVVLHVNVDTLKAEHEQQLELEHEHGESCNCNHDTPANMDYQWISMANAKRFSSDASLYTVLEDRYGNVLNLSRKTRTITTALGRALHIRDESCRFPGCCANKYVDFHHILHWGNGGETEPDNLIKLCRFHHAQLHKGHFTILLQEQTCKNYGQKWIFKNAAGSVIEPSPALSAPRSKTGLKDFMEEQWPHINSQTGVSDWKGKPLNYSKAIGDLIRCKRGH